MHAMKGSQSNDIVLEPVTQIQMDQGTCLSLGPDPAFAVVPGRRAVPSGWCRISYRGDSARGCLSPSLIIDQGDVLGPIGLVELPPSRGERVTAVRRLPTRIGTLHLRPTDAPGRFWIEDFEIQQLSIQEVILEIGRCALGKFAAHPVRLGELSAMAWSAWRACSLEGLKVSVARWLERSGMDYRTWVSCYDSVTDEDRSAIRCRIAAFRRRPVISILLPLLDAPERELRHCLDSVLKQIYPHWELCIADDASSAPAVREVLSEYQMRDARIRVAYRSERGGLSAASNSALDLATAEYAVLLNQEGRLSETACYLVAEALEANPDLQLVYSDEDEVDPSGRRCEPRFKGDWDAERFLQQDYIGQLSLYRTDRMRELGGFRSGYEGSERYELTLRYVAQCDPKRISHLPFVLYHACPATAKNKPGSAPGSDLGSCALRAIDNALEAAGSAAAVEPASFPGLQRVRYFLPEPAPLVTVIIPTRNGAQLVRRCVESIVAKTTYAPLEILLVDNDSDDPVSVGYFAELERSGTLRMLQYRGRFNYSAINNYAVGFAHGDVLALLNNDTEVIDGAWMTELVSYATMPSTGAVGAKLLYPDGTIQHAGIVMGLHGSVGHGQRRTPGDSSGYGGSLAVAREVSAVTGACLVLRKEIFHEVGGLDEQNLPVTFNDVDLCLKLRARGYRNIWTPHAVLYHHEAKTRGPDASGENAARYRREFELMKIRWGALLEQDPYYSPNLSLAGDDNRLAFPPRCSAPWRIDSTSMPIRSDRHRGP